VVPTLISGTGILKKKKNIIKLKKMSGIKFILPMAMS
jgi:hypothetical protein